MYRSVRWLTLLLVLVGCRDTRSESGRARMPDVATGAGSAELENSEPGVEFEAPRLNLTAFRNGVGTLEPALKADLNRVGGTDSGYFCVLSDSVMREIGGAGDVATISPEQGRQAAAQVERLIGIYEERMRKAAN